MLDLLPTLRRFSGKRKAFVLEQLSVLLFMSIEEHAHLPGPREPLRILDRGFVPDVIRSRRGVALDDMQRIAVKITGSIEPGLIVEVGDVDDERVAVPSAAGVAHP